MLFLVSETLPDSWLAFADTLPATLNSEMDSFFPYWPRDARVGDEDTIGIPHRIVVAHLAGFGRIVTLTTADPRPVRSEEVWAFDVRVGVGVGGAALVWKG